MLLDHLLSSPAAPKSTNAGSENATDDEGESVRAVQDLAFVRIRENAGLGRRARGRRGTLDLAVTDLHDRGSVSRARDRAVAEDVRGELCELRNRRSSDEREAEHAGASRHVKRPALGFKDLRVGGNMQRHTE